jgi:hypothetical protein
MAKKQDKKNKNSEEALLGFLKNYGEPEQSQEAAKATVDNQMKSIIAVVAMEIPKSATGTIIDFGCGKGALLQRLSDLTVFIENKGWTYLGSDYDEHKREIIELAFTHDLNRRVDFESLEDFYKKWPDVKSFSRPHLVFCRNVLHELEIDEVTALLSLVSSNLQEGEDFIIQDLQVFPKAEEGNVCWQPGEVEALIKACGFSTVLTKEVSRSGNRWFNVIATRNNSPAHHTSKIASLVINSRLKQWKEWNHIGALHPKDDIFRDVRVAKIDFDLQFASLTRQLMASGAAGIKPLTESQEALVLKEALVAKFQDFKVVKPKAATDVVNSVSYFVNRGNSKDALEKFLVDEHNVVVIQGHPLMGKTELTREVLSKFHHARLPIFIDLQATSSIWNVIEQILSNIRCFINIELLSTLKSISFSSIESYISNFI